jgi:hypothetical protein
MSPNHAALYCLRGSQWMHKDHLVIDASTTSTRICAEDSQQKTPPKFPAEAFSLESNDSKMINPSSGSQRFGIR